jgi:hypothetical protein
MKPLPVIVCTDAKLLHVHCDAHVQIWCGAADTFAKQQAKAIASWRVKPPAEGEVVVPFKSTLKNTRPACVVVPATPLLHQNFRTIAKNLTAHSDWERAGGAAWRAYHSKFKKWAVNPRKEAAAGKLPTTNLEQIRERCVVATENAIAKAAADRAYKLGAV